MSITRIRSISAKLRLKSWYASWKPKLQVGHPTNRGRGSSGSSHRRSATILRSPQPHQSLQLRWRLKQSDRRAIPFPTSVADFSQPETAIDVNKLETGGLHYSNSLHSSDLQSSDFNPASPRRNKWTLRWPRPQFSRFSEVQAEVSGRGSGARAGSAGRAAAGAIVDPEIRAWPQTVSESRWNLGPLPKRHLRKASNRSMPLPNTTTPR